MTKLSKKEISKLQEELNTYLEENEDTTLKQFVEESQYDTKKPEKLGDHTFKFVHYGSTDGIDVETRDGCGTEYVFEIDGNLYAMYGYYSSYGDSEIDNEDLTPVELATREETFYAEVDAA